MAAYDAPLVPGQPDVTGQAPAVPGQQETTSLGDQWRQWMADPHNRSALMQFGLALSQPIPAGQNWAGQIGQAFGQAGEASQRVTEEQHRQTAEEQRQQEIESREELRRAQAEFATERAAHAGERSAGIQERIQAQRDIAGVKANLQARIAYDAYKKATIAQNEKSELYGTPKRPILEFEDWLATSPNLPAMLNTGAPGNPMVDQKTGLSRTPVQTPADVLKLPPGTPYIRPDGRTGTSPGVGT